jgi:hypothetical protein
MSQPLSPEELNARIETLLNANNFGLPFWHTSAAPPLVLTYQFETAEAADFPWGQRPIEIGELATFPEVYKEQVRIALAEYSDVINVQFLEVTGSPDAEISFYRFGSGPPGTRGLGHFSPPSDSWDGFVAYNTNQNLTDETNFRRVLHEIGHSLGLKHPGNYDVTGGGAAGPFLPPSEDSNKYTLMSYTRNPDSNSSVDKHLMLYDIASLQIWWGANLSTRTGNDTYTADSESLLRAIWDAGGTDSIAYGGTADAYIDLRAGTFSSLGATDNLAIAYGVTIENAVGGGGDDGFVGNAADNVLDGASGVDRAFYEGPLSGYQLKTALDRVSILITDIDASNGDAGTDTLRDMEWARFGTEDVALNPAAFPLDTDWTAEVEDVQTVAATWQYFMHIVPSAEGFEYLIKSAINPTDLNDMYFQKFSLENRYMAFASNLAFEAAAANWFEREYGDLSYADAVEKAYEDIVTSAAAIANGIDPELAKRFFTEGQSYFEAVAIERIVRPGVALDDATKLALIASVLNEAVRADIGPLAAAVNDFADEVSVTHTSPHFGGSLMDLG